MRRDDSFLNTGMSTAAERRISAKREQEKQKALEKKGQLLPAADAILSLVSTERLKNQDLRDFVISAESLPTDIKDELLARKKHDAFLTRFEAQIKIILRKEASND